MGLSSGDIEILGYFRAKGFLEKCYLFRRAISSWSPIFVPVR